LIARTANTVAAVDSAAGGAKYDRSGVGAVHAAAVKKTRRCRLLLSPAVRDNNNN